MYAAVRACARETRHLRYADAVFSPHVATHGAPNTAIL